MSPGDAMEAARPPRAHGTCVIVPAMSSAEAEADGVNGTRVDPSMNDDWVSVREKDGGDDTDDTPGVELEDV